MMISIPSLGLTSKHCRKSGDMFVLNKQNANPVLEFMLKCKLTYSAEIDGNVVSLIVHRITMADVFFKVAT